MAPATSSPGTRVSASTSSRRPASGCSGTSSVRTRPEASRSPTEGTASSSGPTARPSAESPRARGTSSPTTWARESRSRASPERLTGNTIRGNSIFSNGGIGIDLGGDGVTANDALDADNGPNQRQNYPIIVSAAPTAPSGTNVTGRSTARLRRPTSSTSTPTRPARAAPRISRKACVLGLRQVHRRLRTRRLRHGSGIHDRGRPAGRP